MRADHGPLRSSAPPQLRLAEAGRAMAEPILKVTNIETYYGPIMAIRGVSFEVPAGRHRHHPGRQRRGQDHRAQDHVRRHGPAEGQRRLRGPRDPAHGSRQGDAARRQPCARGPRGLPLPERAREPAHGRLHAPRRRRRRPGSRGGVRLLPGAARARRPARRLAVGRRAADAGDQPGADGAAQADAARRAVARPVARSW